MHHDNPDDKNLKFWHAYIKGVRPIHKNLPLNTPKAKSSDDDKQKNISITMPSDINIIRKNPVLLPKAHELSEKINPIEQFKAEKNAKKRMKKGAFIFDAKIDLHGQTQTQAFDNLHAFITRNYLSNIRHLLIITGRGRYCYKTLSPLGILIKKVPEWLRSSPFAQMISVIETASNTDGGEGALYVVLRKNGL
jgi:DNA-nicking Smr family endonuclease